MQDAVAEILRIRSHCSLTEAELLAPVKHPVDATADWLGHDTYLTYYAIGQYFKPTVLAEIGSRYGYSLHALYAGSLNVNSIYSFDSGYDFEDSCAYVHEKFHARPGVKIQVVKKDTQKLYSLSHWIFTEVDLFHVDGNHSEKGVYHDCELAWRYLRPGGVLLIDDVSNGETVKKGADTFVAGCGAKATLIPCYRGIYILQKPLKKKP